MITELDYSDYSSLITSEHNKRENYMAMLKVTGEPFVDLANELLATPGYYDLDTATGSQLDVVGEWVGITRYLATELTGVYFAFDTTGVGFDQGTWYEDYNPTTGVTQLSDDDFRTLIRAKILLNEWDGTREGAYDIWEVVFGSDYTVFIEDNQDMTISIGLISSSTLGAVTKALFLGGYLDIKPAGVGIKYRIISTVNDSPVFGFDGNGTGIAGFDTGSWANIVASS